MTKTQTWLLMQKEWWGLLLRAGIDIRDVNKAPISGTYHRLPAGTELPDGIDVVADGKDVGGLHAATHHTICPSKRMSGQTFIEKFKNMPWVKAGKK